MEKKKKPGFKFSIRTIMESWELLFLIGNVTLKINVEIGSILLGSLVGILIAVVIQFGKGIVDYQRTELLQFEDDDYYYYVKAVPKLSVTELNKNVKHINSKMHN